MKTPCAAVFPEPGSTAHVGGLNISAGKFCGIARFRFGACGIAVPACRVTGHMIARFARIPVACACAAEFRSRNSPLFRNTLGCVMSQSDETIAPLAARRKAKRQGCQILAGTYGAGAPVAREADGGIDQHVGPEIGVASTQAFAAPFLIGAMLALSLGRLRDLSCGAGPRSGAARTGPPALRRQAREQAPHSTGSAQRCARYADRLFLGRMSLFPIAPESTLKPKKSFCRHAEGSPAAERKHGPIAHIREIVPASVFGERRDLAANHCRAAEIQSPPGPDHRAHHARGRTPRRPRGRGHPPDDSHRYRLTTTALP